MNQLVLCVKFLVAALPVAVGFIDGLLFRLSILFVQVISAIQQTQERVLMKHMDTDQKFTAQVQENSVQTYMKCYSVHLS